MCRFLFFFSFCHSPQRRDCSGSTLIQMISVSKGSPEDNSRGGLRWNNMIKSHPSAVRGNALTETAHPGQAPKITICVSCFMTEGPGKKHRTNKPPPKGRVWERSKGDTMCLTTSRNPSCWHLAWLSNVCNTREDPESERSAKDNSETHPNHSKS